MKSLVLITTHAISTASDLGLDMPREHLEYLMENRVRRNFKMAIKVKQGVEDRWIIPFAMPASIYCDKICCWLVVSTPKDARTLRKYEYILRTLLHENNPIVRSYWHHDGAESPVLAYMKYWSEMNDLSK